MGGDINALSNWANSESVLAVVALIVLIVGGAAVLIIALMKMGGPIAEGTKSVLDGTGAGIKGIGEGAGDTIGGPGRALVALATGVANSMTTSAQAELERAKNEAESFSFVLKDGKGREFSLTSKGTGTVRGPVTEMLECLQLIRLILLGHLQSNEMSIPNCLEGLLLKVLL